MSKRTIRISEANGDDGPVWLTTFNDLVTLLMVFFVLLFAMGSVDTKMLQEFQYGLQSGLGILGEGSKVSIIRFALKVIRIMCPFIRPDFLRIENCR